MSKKTIRVFNKHGKFIAHITREKAVFSVNRGKSKWIEPDAIQVLFHYKDEKRMKREVYERDGYVCYICEKQMHPGHPELTIDHVIPQNQGGSVLPQNQRTCCRKCNEEKAGRSPVQYMKAMLLCISYHLIRGGCLIGKAEQATTQSRAYS